MSVDHYENFPVASLLCPARLRPAVKAIYWFARTADDIADEGHAPVEQRLADLAAYEEDLDRVAAGVAPSTRWRGVFEPIAEALTTHRLPDELLRDLLSAFRQDVTQHDYADRAQLIDYCRRSANPIGRLLLHLHGVHDNQALTQSDAICTALQLANFWQDLRIDTRRGRLYPPASDRMAHGVSAEALLHGIDSPGVRALMADLVGWTRTLMHSGEALVHVVPGRAGWELRLVVQGGLRILEKIERARFGVMLECPRLRWYDAAILIPRALRMRMPPNPLASRAA